MAAGFQEKTLNAGTTSVSFIGAPGAITLSGPFDTATVTQTMTGDSTPIATFTAEDDIYFNGQRVTFTKTGGAGSENISVKWFKNRTPY